MSVSVREFICDNGPVELTGPLVNAMYQTVDNMERQGIDTDEILDTLEHMLPVRVS